MKKYLMFALFIGFVNKSHGQFPSIDPTAIQRLIELKNTVATLKKGLALQKNIGDNTQGDEANSTALLEAQTKIEDILRDSDEYVRLAYQNTPLADMSNLTTFSKNLKGSLLGNLNSSAWKMQDVKTYLEGSSYSAKAGADMYDALTKGFSLDNKQGTNNISTYYDRLTQFYNRQYALQTALQKKKMQQALTYYKMADELEAKAQTIADGVKSPNAGKPFTLQNKGVFGLAKTGIGGLFDDAFSSEGISIPNMNNLPLVVNDKTYMMDVEGNVYDVQGNFITKDITFGINEQAQAAYEQAKNNKSAIGNFFSSDNISNYVNELLKQRMEALAQYQANKMQSDIYNNILKNALSGKEGNGNDYTGLLNSLNVGGSLGGLKSGLRMSTGERIQGNAVAISLMEKAQELREKADSLMMEALQRTQEQKQLEAVWQKEMIRKSLSKMTL